MKSQDQKALHSKTKEELESLLRDKTAQMAKIRMDIKSKRIKNTRLAFNFRKEIAKIKSVLIRFSECSDFEKNHVNK